MSTAAILCLNVVPHILHYYSCRVLLLAAPQHHQCLTFTVLARTLLENLKTKLHLNNTHKMAANGALCGAVHRRCCDVTRFHGRRVLWKLGYLLVLDRDVDWGKKLCNCVEALSSRRRLPRHSECSVAAALCANVQ